MNAESIACLSQTKDPRVSGARSLKGGSRVAVIEELAAQFYHSYRSPEPVADSEAITELMVTATELGAWPLVLAVFGSSRGECSGRVGKAAKQEQLLMACFAALQMGYVAQAENLLRRLLLEQPDQERALELHRFLQDWDSFCEQRSPGVHRICAGENLYLQLLGHQHGESFAQIYSSETAYFCQLPNFQSLADWHHWLNVQHADMAERVFAVMHRQWGMVGVVSLVAHAQRGFFYYWIGNEFRGQGFGPDAVAALLKTAAENWGLHTCFAKAYEFNEASLTGLRKLGFERLRIKAAPPYDNELFFRRGPEMEDDAVVEEMQWFYDCIGCDKRFLWLAESGLPARALSAKSRYAGRGIALSFARPQAG